ncbi:YafY family transcriptional regulator [Defluviimonas sp. WL0002]|uniref:YafY family transcriptional regulator n=1 Tax=Albidovulum marisflavi TaxID=2984159 RepID=A0ABT2ZFD4_9RHOB|nr:YafY family protein [Defluviimonas sp. WL0002]MCV2869811.1 YafY family transcriptional regulator [Defluviimonas sp. WL0002]
MPRPDRLLDLIRILRDGKLHRAVDLAEKTGVSVRTIWRDMGRLQAGGVPIEGERGIGYMLRDPVALPPVALSRDEFEALRLGLGLVASGADQTAARAAVSLRAKIAAVAPTILAEAGSDSFVFSSAEAARAAPHLGLIRRAIREHLTLSLSYRDETGTETQRRIRPLQLEFWGKVWTLLAWCELRADFRFFRVDMIIALVPDGGAFMPEPGRTVEDYLARLAEP